MALAAARRRWIGLIVISLGVATIIVDSTIVNVAIPSIVADLGITTIADALHLHVSDVTVLQGHDGEDTNVRLTLTPANNHRSS